MGPDPCTILMRIPGEKIIQSGPVLIYSNKNSPVTGATQRTHVRARNQAKKNMKSELLQKQLGLKNGKWIDRQHGNESKCQQLL